MAQKTDLSIVILNHNTKELLGNCLQSLKKVADEIAFEVIVADNGSEDGSQELVREKYPWVRLIENGGNLGFAKGNNQARGHCTGNYVLFLNSDTVMHKGTLGESTAYMEGNPAVGALTVKTVLPSGKLDKDARRSFPTPWVAVTHFSGFDRLFPKSRLFARYWYGYMSPDAVHEVDVLQGAYFLIRKKVLDAVGWFSEEYFLDGEDIDLSWKIKATGAKVVYYPKVSITHIKKATKRKVKNVFTSQGVEAMIIFYKKFMWKRYPAILNWMVLSGIYFLRVVRNITRHFFLR